MIKTFMRLMVQHEGDIKKVSEETGFETFFIYNTLTEEFPDRTARESWIEYFGRQLAIRSDFLEYFK